MVESLKDSLEKIDKSNELTVFFTNLWKEDLALGRLFFLHREQLFPSEDKTIIPYIFWSNAQEENEKPSILDIITQLEETKMQQAWTKLGFGELLNENKDLFAFAAMKIIRENESIRKLVLDQDFSFRKMKEILGDYKGINFDVLKQEEIESIPELELILKANIVRFIKTFDPIKFVEALSSTSGITMTLPLMGIPHLDKILEVAGMELEEYTDIINELYVLRLISNSQTLFWCEYCLDTPQILVTTSRIDPDHLKMRCLKCTKPMLVSAIYSIDASLKECILFKDGLLAVALGWLFDKRKIKWDFSVHNKYENDFICETKDGKILFECKMHLIPRDERSLEGQLKQDLTLLIAHVKTLCDDGISFKRVFLVYNYDLDEYLEEYSEAKRILEEPELKRDMTRYNIESISFPDIIPVLEKELPHN